MRVTHAQAFEGLVTATGEALKAVATSDCIGWVKHDGYCVPDPFQ